MPVMKIITVKPAGGPMPEPLTLTHKSPAPNWPTHYQRRQVMSKPHNPGNLNAHELNLPAGCRLLNEDEVRDEFRDGRYLIDKIFIRMNDRSWEPHNMGCNKQTTYCTSLTVAQLAAARDVAKNWDGKDVNELLRNEAEAIAKN
jgi:hypothetical protein